MTTLSLNSAIQTFVSIISFFPFEYVWDSRKVHINDLLFHWTTDCVVWITVLRP